MKPATWEGLVGVSARNPRIHGTGEPWATLAWALVGAACAPLALGIAWALGKWAMGWGA
jgi:hypothetical protein